MGANQDQARKAWLATRAIPRLCSFGRRIDIVFRSSIIAIPRTAAPA